MNTNKSEFACVNKFCEECDSDIIRLIEIAQKEQDDMQLFIASAIVLLGAKFESCVESIILEYVDKINIEADKELIPEELKFSSIYNKLLAYSNKMKSNHFDCFTNNNVFISDISNFINSIMTNSSNLKINNKFNYGEHGYKELTKLFKNIAIDITTDDINSFQKTGLFGAVEVVNFDAKFNEFVNYRNQVSHQNEYPNITCDDVKKIMEIFKDFIINIDKELSKRLNAMISNY